jgi:hypothetical protein
MPAQVLNWFAETAMSNKVSDHPVTVFVCIAAAVVGLMMFFTGKDLPKFLSSEDRPPQGAPASSITTAASTIAVPVSVTAEPSQERKPTEQQKATTQQALAEIRRQVKQEIEDAERKRLAQQADESKNERRSLRPERKKSNRKNTPKKNLKSRNNAKRLRVCNKNNSCATNNTKPRSKRPASAHCARSKRDSMKGEGLRSKNVPHNSTAMCAPAGRNPMVHGCPVAAKEAVIQPGGSRQSYSLSSSHYAGLCTLAALVFGF